MPPGIRRPPRVAGKQFVPASKDTLLHVGGNALCPTPGTYPIYIPEAEGDKPWLQLFPWIDKGPLVIKCATDL